MGGLILKYIKNKQGMALGVVLGIMGVIAVLATSMFYFTSNELKFSQLNTNREQANYLARSGVEVAAKAYPGVAARFEGVDEDHPVETSLYLHKDGDQFEINDTEEDSLGKVDVVITEKTKEYKVKNGTRLETLTRSAVCYKATSKVADSQAIVNGYTILPASALTVNTTSPGKKYKTYLNWTNTGGNIVGDKINYSYAYDNGKRLHTYKTNYNGVVNILREDL